jgi:hypothetical protein
MVAHTVEISSERTCAYELYEMEDFYENIIIGNEFLGRISKYCIVVRILLGGCLIISGYVHMEKQRSLHCWLW